MPNVYSRLWRSQLKSTIFNRLRHLAYSIAAFRTANPRPHPVPYQGQSKEGVLRELVDSWWGATGGP